MPLRRLPPELTLEILAYLDISSLCTFPQLSKAWLAFTSTNESLIYYNAAVLHNIAGYGDNSNETLKKVVLRYESEERRLWKGVESWKEFCRRRFTIDKNWTGHGQSVLRNISSGQDGVHRIKVDEKEGICITTHIKGGLIVTNLYPSYILWGLPPAYVHQYAHIEYSSGYLTFNRLDGSHEVWRLARHIPDGVYTSEAPPDDIQLSVYGWAKAMFGTALGTSIAPSTPATVDSTAVHLRGHFRPHALLDPPEDGFASRCVHPTLVISGSSSLFLYDVPSGRLEQTIPNVIGEEERVGYVDVNEDWVLMCASEAGLSVFSRKDEEGERGRRVFQLNNQLKGLWTHRVPLNSKVETPSMNEYKIVQRQNLNIQNIRLRDGETMRGPYTAVHISEDGQTLIATVQSSILIVKDWQRVARGELELQDVALRIIPKAKNDDKAGGSGPKERSVDIKYLAYACERFTVATTKGILVFTLDTHNNIHPTHCNKTSLPLKIPPTLSYPFLQLSVPIVLKSPSLSPESYRHFSCLQMTRTRVYFTWDLRASTYRVKQMIEKVESALKAEEVMDSDEDEEEEKGWKTELGRKRRNWNILSDRLMGHFVQHWSPPENYSPSVGCIDFGLMGGREI